MKILPKKPSAAAVAVMAILTVVFSSAAVLSLRVSAAALAVTFGVAVASLSYILRFLGNPLFLLLPFAAAAVGAETLVPSLLCAAAVALCGAVFALLLRGGVDSFAFFISGGLLYSVISGAVFVYALISSFGSLSKGLEWLGATLLAFISEMLKGYDETTVSMLTSSSEPYLFVFPSVVFAVGLFTMWITKWSLSCMTAFTKMRGRMYSRVTRAPKALAWTFILLSVFGMLFYLGTDVMYYGIMNLRTVLGIIFMGEGVREFARLIINMRSGVKRVIVVVVLVNLVSVLAPVFAMVAAYYGAYKTVFRSVKLPRGSSGSHTGD